MDVVKTCFMVVTTRVDALLLATKSASLAYIVNVRMKGRFESDKL